MISANMASKMSKVGKMKKDYEYFVIMRDEKKILHEFCETTLNNMIIEETRLGNHVVEFKWPKTTFMSIQDKEEAIQEYLKPFGYKVICCTSKSGHVMWS